MTTFKSKPMELDHIDISSEESRRRLAKMLLKLFDHWQLSTSEKLELLGLSANSRSLLSSYSNGSKSLPASRDTMDRAGWLLAIHKALRLLYPYNEDIRYTWIKRHNKMLENLTPLDLIKNEGIIGLAKVARFLDFQRGR